MFGRMDIVMPTPTTTDIREAILKAIEAQQPKSQSDQQLQQSTVLEAVATHLGIRQDPDIESAILTQWHDLFRTGFLAWAPKGRGADERGSLSVMPGPSWKF